MKLLLQWALASPSNWIEVDASQWASLPKKADPTGLGLSVDGQPGWVGQINIQGLTPIADHYAVEHVDAETLRLTVWCDDPAWVTDGRYAVVWTIKTLAPDPLFGGALNTRQSPVVYAEGEAFDRFVAGQWQDVRPWSEFAIPHESITRHGKQLSDQQWAAHQAKATHRGWRHFTEGIDPSELVNGEVPSQRRRLPGDKKDSRYPVPLGTKTCYQSDTAQATGIHAATNEYAFLTSYSGSAGSLSVTAAKGASGLGWCFTSPANWPNDADWPSGNYRCQLDITANDYSSVALGTVGSATGHFARVDSGLTADQQTWAQAESAFTGTGLKLASTGTIDPSSGSATDRYECLIAWYNSSSKNSSITLRVNVSDDYADGPWAGSLSVTVTGETASATEAVSTAKTVPPIIRTIDDSVTVTETVQLVINALRLPSDSVSATDGAGRTTDYAHTAADTAETLTETTRIELSALRAVVELLLAAETGQAELSAEPVAVTDSALASASKGKLAADADLALTDSALRSAEYARASTESCTVSDSVTTQLYAIRSASATDAVTVDDTVIAARDLAGKASDTLTASDSVLAERFTFAQTAEASDEVEVTDAVLAALSLLVRVTDECSASDSSSRCGTLELRCSDNVAAACSGQVVLTRPPAGHDPVFVTDSVAAVIVVLPSRSVSDTLSTTEDLLRQAEYKRASAEVVDVDSTVLASVSFSVRCHDDLVAVDSATRAAEPSGRDAATVTDVAVRETDYRRSFADELQVADAVAGRSEHGRIVGDSAVVAEQALREADYRRTSSDAIAVSDALLVTSLLSRVGADTLTVTEALDRKAEYARLAADTLSVTDSVAAQKFGGVGVVLADSVSVTDSALARAEFSRTAADSVDATDSLYSTRSRQAQATDTLVVTEAVRAGLDASRTASDSVAAADDLQRAAWYVRSIAETESAIDLALAAETGAENPVDLVSATDALAREANYARVASDAETATDAVAALLQRVLPVAVSDACVVTESLQRHAEFAVVCADVLEATDSVAIATAGELAREASDTLSATELAQREAQYARALSEQEVVDDSWRTETVYHRCCYDEISVVEEGVFTREVANAVSVTDTLDVNLLRPTQQRSCEEALVVTDVVAATGQLERTLAETLVVTDAVLAEKFVSVLERSAHDDVSVSDQVVTGLEALRRTSDEVSVAEALLREADYTRPAADAALAAADLAETQAFKLHRVSLLDEIAATDQARRAHEFLRVLADSVELAELVQVTGDKLVRCADTVTVTDAVARHAQLVATAQDIDLVVTEQAVALLEAGCTVADTVSVTDEVVLTASKLVRVSDSVEVTEYVAHTNLCELAFSETLAVTDQVSRIGDGNRTCEDAVVVSDICKIEAGLNIFDSDQVAATDEALRAADYHRRLSDAVVATSVVDAGLQKVAYAADSVAATDAVRVTLEYARNVLDEPGVTDVVRTASQFLVQCADECSVTDYAATSAYGYLNVECSDSVAVSDTPLRWADYYRGATDVAVTADVASTYTDFHATIHDDVAATDSVARQLYILNRVSVSDAVDVSDAALRVAWYHRYSHDDISVTEAEGNYRLVYDYIGAYDYVLAERFVSVLIVELTEALETVDSVTAGRQWLLALVAALTAEDASSRIAWYSRQLSESLVATDAVDIVSAGYYSVALLDTLSVIDTVRTATQYSLRVSDTCSAADSCRTSAAFDVALTATISATDSTCKYLDALRRSTDAVAATDIAATSVGYGCTLADTLSASDSLAVAVDHGRGCIDELVLTDATACATDYHRHLVEPLTVTEEVDAGLTNELKVKLYEYLDVTDHVGAGRDFLCTASETLSVTTTCDALRTRWDYTGTIIIGADASATLCAPESAEVTIVIGADASETYNIAQDGSGTIVIGVDASATLKVDNE